MREIAVQQIGKIQEALTRRERRMTVSSEALEQIVQDGYSLAYGARFLKRVIDERIKMPISQRWTEGTHFVVNVRDGKIEIDVSSDGGAIGSRQPPSGDSAPDEGRLLRSLERLGGQRDTRSGCAGIDVARRPTLVALPQRVDQSPDRIRRSPSARTHRGTSVDSLPAGPGTLQR